MRPRMLTKLAKDVGVSLPKMESMWDSEYNDALESNDEDDAIDIAMDSLRNKITMATEIDVTPVTNIKEAINTVALTRNSMRIQLEDSSSIIITPYIADKLVSFWHSVQYTSSSKEKVWSLLSRNSDMFYKTLRELYKVTSGITDTFEFDFKPRIKVIDTDDFSQCPNNGIRQGRNRWITDTVRNKNLSPEMPVLQAVIQDALFSGACKLVDENLQIPVRLPLFQGTISIPLDFDNFEVQDD